MILRCPVCRAENGFVSQCRRCRADLSLLAAVEARRDYHIARARAAAQEGRIVEGLAQVDDAEKLRSGPDVRQLKASILLMAGDYQAAVAASVGKGQGGGGERG